MSKHNRQLSQVQETPQQETPQETPQETSAITFDGFETEPIKPETKESNGKPKTASTVKSKLASIDSLIGQCDKLFALRGEEHVKQALANGGYFEIKYKGQSHRFNLLEVTAYGWAHGFVKDNMPIVANTANFKLNALLVGVDSEDTVHCVLVSRTYQDKAVHTYGSRIQNLAWFKSFIG